MPTIPRSRPMPGPTPARPPHRRRRLRRAAALGVAIAAGFAGSAHASSLVYVKNGDVWSSSPDGAQQVQISHGGGYAEPSQADDGTIVATRADGRLYRLDRRGALLNEPVATWLAGGAPGFSGPSKPVVSLDGSKVAYSWSIRDSAYDYGCGCYVDQTALGTAYSYADRYTDPNELGKFRGWSPPSWTDAHHPAVFDPAALGADSGSPNVAFHELGHADPGSEDDLGHVFGLLEDADAPSIQFGAMTRAGNKFAGAEDIPALRLRFYALPGVPRPGMPNYDAQYRCQLTDPPGGHFDALSWAPDGTSLAYSAGGDIYVVSVGNLAGGCTVGHPVKVISGATSPSWGPAAVAPGRSAPSGTTSPAQGDIRVRVVGRPHLRAML